MAIFKGWTDNRDVIDEAFKILNSSHWRVIQATYGNKKLVPKSPGIYIFSTRATILRDDIAHTLENPFYIGASDSSIESRHRAHIIRPEWKRASIAYGRDFIYSYLVLEGYEWDVIRDYEDILIRSFGPILNDKYSKSRKSSESQ